MYKAVRPCFKPELFLPLVGRRERQGGDMIRLFVGVVVGLNALVTTAFAADPVEIAIGYLRRAGATSAPRLSGEPAENDGVAGARLAMDDNRRLALVLDYQFARRGSPLKDGDDAANAAV